MALFGLVRANNLSDVVDRERAWDNIGANFTANLTSDPDSVAYVTAVEAADGQSLEPAVRLAIGEFILGCKQDGIWDAIKASCILGGARTLAGALVPLAGTAPTNFNFVSGDYNRKTGLVGDGSTKYLNSNRLRTSDPQDSFHLSVFTSTIHTLGTFGFYAGAGLEAVNSATGFSHLGRFNTGNHYVRNTSSTLANIGAAAAGFYATSRGSGAEYQYRNNSITATSITASQTPPDTTTKIFIGRILLGALNSPVDARLAFYSIGESLDLALLDTRVTSLINAFAAAIP